MTKSNVSKAYQVVTDRLITVIEDTKELPWRRPWRKGVLALAGVNHVSGNAYRGINAFMTALFTELAGYDSNEWVTFRQAKEKGGQVRRGEKGLPIVYFNFQEKNLEMDNVKTGEKENHKVKIPFARYSTVFNLSQVDGIEYKSISTTEEEKFDHKPIAVAEEQLAAFNGVPKIVHDQDNRAFYKPSTDTINIPELNEFRTAEGYYSTLFHELIHSTGHRDRLNRRSLTDSHGFGDHEYSKEELIAEMGACFLNSDAGIFDQNLMESAAYLQGWLKALKENPAWLVQSANAAQKAVDFLKHGES